MIYSQEGLLLLCSFQKHYIFIEHQYWMNLNNLFDWCVCLPYLNYSIFWTCFCYFFIPVVVITHCYNASVWYPWNFDLVLFFPLLEFNDAIFQPTFLPKNKMNKTIFPGYLHISYFNNFISICKKWYWYIKY